MSIQEVILRIIITFITLLILARMMGRKEVGQLTFFNFISAISIGSIGASLAINSNLSIRNGLIALVGWTIITIIFDLIDIKSKGARTAISGQPSVLIKNGKIMESELRKSRLDIDTLNALLRQNSVHSMKDVDHAILEVDGKLSVMKKEEQRPATKSDVNAPIPTYPYPLATSVISDGKIIHQNLKKLNLDVEWLTGQLKQQGIQNLSEVFYGEMQQDGTLYIDQKSQELNG
ncbi:YetF domain-containing protein [Tenuibacillus multivorans]|uniref:Uncharacterized membrane protein YcaP, DUF421 family n=1 Tax=Tenuibacillus multivorans TaxID=237069 RepID=A0A1G9ZPT9_9BACI|nr:DUF421 domain-containing protein [Tenuibacillus multivorans]GEL77432.1 DUF421 domain-containing protein [Tenuibacillus multivorans]SDN22643.1 Uncharacterized membrane protein YcaP, DUF421 family [Tenuibacillus multivorans]